MKSSYDDVIPDVVDVLLLRSKYCNTDGRCVWTASGIILKSNAHLVIFHISLSTFLRVFSSHQKRKTGWK